MLRLLRNLLILLFSFTLYSCSDNEQKNVNRQQNVTIDTILKDTITDTTEKDTLPRETIFLDKIANSVYEIRKKTSGKWRYDSRPYKCANKMERDSILCFFFEYAAYIDGCSDVIGKPCLKKMLEVSTKRYKKNNLNLNKIVDPNEIIISFSVFCTHTDIENSKIIGTHSNDLSNLIAPVTSRDGDTIKYRTDKWNVKIILASDTVKEIRYYTIH